MTMDAGHMPVGYTWWAALRLSDRCLQSGVLQTPLKNLRRSCSRVDRQSYKEGRRISRRRGLTAVPLSWVFASACVDCALSRVLREAPCMQDMREDRRVEGK